MLYQHAPSPCKFSSAKSLRPSLLFTVSNHQKKNKSNTSMKVNPVPRTLSLQNHFNLLPRPFVIMC
jgi:hypothetical protein